MRPISFEPLEARELLATFTLGPLTFSGPNLASTNNVVTGTGVDVGFTPTGAEAFKALFSTPGTVTFTQGTLTPDFTVDGDIVAPSGPGLGVEPDPEKVARYRV